MQQISPRKYFETRLRQLPIFKCLVNQNWEDQKMANVMVLRQHVNGHVSGANFLVDLLCLGVKDAAWFFNTDPDELQGLSGNTNPPMVEIPYNLAHNIVYAGLEFADVYNIKPHADFAIARFALEEDDDSIELMEIETGVNGMPHLIERHPGQYADAHSKLKKHAGTGNFKISVVFDTEEEADETEADWEQEDDDFDEDEEYEDADDFYVEVSLKDIAVGKLTILDALALSDEELNDESLLDTRLQNEKLTLNIEKAIRIFESIAEELEMDPAIQNEVDFINEKTEDDFAFDLDKPNGCEEGDLEKGFEYYIQMMDAINGLDLDEKTGILVQHFQSNESRNPVFVALCLFYLMMDDDGPALYEKIHQEILPHRNIPMVALAQSFLITNAPDRIIHPPFIKDLSPSLKEVLPEFPEFSAEEYCMFYALRCLEATKLKQIPQAWTWYRLLAETGEADVYIPMLASLQTQLIGMMMEEMKKLEEI